MSIVPAPPTCYIRSCDAIVIEFHLPAQYTGGERPFGMHRNDAGFGQLSLIQATRMTFLVFVVRAEHKGGSYATASSSAGCAPHNYDLLRRRPSQQRRIPGRSFDCI